MVGFDLEPLLQGKTRIAKLKSVYKLLIIGPKDYEYAIRYVSFYAYRTDIFHVKKVRSNKFSSQSVLT